MTDIIEYFEDLTSLEITCPHDDAFAPDGKQTYFRVLKHNPATSESFLPKVLKEGKPVPDVCIAKSVSIYDSLDALINGYYRVPAHKKKKRLIGVLTLTQQDGMLKQTFAAGHHSWWRAKAFVPETVSIQTVEA